MTNQDHTQITRPQEGPLPSARLAYSIAEVAKATGLSRDLLYNEMRAGRLAYLKIGRRRIITRQQLEDFLATGAA